MARKKISELDDGGVFQAGDSILIARDGANFKMNGAQIANTVANVANTASAITDVSANVATLTSTLSGATTRIDALEATVANTASSSSIAAVTSRVTTLEGQIANVATSDSITAVTGRVTTLEGTVANNAATISNVTSRVATLEASGGGGGGLAPLVTAHRYWRIVPLATTGGANYVYCAELKMMVTDVGANLATGGTPLSSGDYGAGTPKSAAFDGDTNTKWESQQGATPSSGTVWIGYDFGSPKAIGAFAWTCTTYFENERPTRGRVDYSDDGTTWVSAWEWGPFTWPTGVVATRTAMAPDPKAGLYAVKPPTATTFPTLVNGTNANTAIVADAAMLSIWRTDEGNSTTNTHRVSGRVKPISGSDWSAKMIYRVPAAGVVGKGIRIGILVRESSSGKMAIFGWNYVKSGNPALSGSNFDNTETLGLLIVSGGDIRHTETVSIRVDYASGKFTMYASNNFGRSWITLGSNNVSWVPDQIGLGLSTYEAVPAGICSMDVLHYSDPTV